MNINLKSKVVIITGAANGIGKIIAEQFAFEGVKLSLWDIDYNELVSTSKTIIKKSNNNDIISIKCDVKLENQVNDAILETINKFGTIDILIANAGILNPSKVLDTTVERWDEVFDVNTKGPFLCAKAVAQYLKDKNLFNEVSS
jgi:NAD(P)-dependent dehydrogenase (short-subunit alcohol dehydrogenase family)